MPIRGLAKSDKLPMPAVPTKFLLFIHRYLGCKISESNNLVVQAVGHKRFYGLITVRKQGGRQKETCMARGFMLVVR